MKRLITDIAVVLFLTGFTAYRLLHYFELIE